MRSAVSHNSSSLHTFAQLQCRAFPAAHFREHPPNPTMGSRAAGTTMLGHLQLLLLSAGCLQGCSCSLQPSLLYSVCPLFPKLSLRHPRVAALPSHAFGTGQLRPCLTQQSHSLLAVPPHLTPAHLHYCSELLLSRCLAASLSQTQMPSSTFRCYSENTASHMAT